MARVNTKPKVLLIDDHPIVRAGCRRFLEQGVPAEVIEAGSGEEGWRSFLENSPDLLVLDLTLPGIGGLELIQKVRAYDPRAQILVFSMHADPIFAARALEAGARGYVVKSSSPQELLDAVLQVLRGGNYLSHEVAQEIALLNLTSGGDPLKELSARELEILRLIGEGRTLTEIAAILCVSYKTVANSVSQIKTKLRARHTSELVRLALHHGLAGSSK